MYCLTSTDPADPDRAGLAGRLRHGVTEAVLGAGAHGVQLNVADAAAEPAAPLRIITSPSPADAVLSVWVDSANDPLRRRMDEAVASGPWSCAAYLVTESAPLPDGPDVPAEPSGEGWRRTAGFAQLAFLQRPDGLGHQEWLSRWLGDHTQVAIDTQSTFVYVQNVVTRVLTPGATPWDAIVEECFPAAAMTDPQVFFDAGGDDERLAANQSRMFDSVQRFVDLETIEVIATSRFVMPAPVPRTARAAER